MFSGVRKKFARPKKTEDEPARQDGDDLVAEARNTADAGAGGASPPQRAPDAGTAVREILGGEDSGARSAEFEEFLDEQTLTSRDALGKKEMKIKILGVSDEYAPSKWKLGDRVKAERILVTIKHLESMKVEEAEFDIAAIEAELASRRHYTSSNRWIPVSDIRNGYVVKTRHMPLISDAIALDYIVF